jgi:arylsulfatase A-like enzyme
MFSRLVILLALIAAVLGGGDRLALAANRTASRPNIVMILIDDLGWGDFSCFGNKKVETTNIDRLAAEGIRFEQFYVNAPICSPSRTAISTGQYPMRWRLTSYLSNRQENQRRGIAQWLDPKAPMLARMLHDAGYTTGHFGKWHMGGQRDVGDAPLIRQYGFDETLTSFEGLGPRVLPLLDAYDGKEAQKHALGSDTLGHGPIHWEKRDQITKTYTDAAFAFIDKARAAGRPFYLNLWPDDVHSPFFPPKNRRGNESKRDRYLGVLKTMDEQLGPLFDHIRSDPSLRDNTLILICSDNGPEDGAGSAGPFRGKKGMLYEGGIRSPLVVWAPGLQTKNKTGTANSTSVLAAIDLAPSLLAIAGVTKPANVQFDGEPLDDVLLGRSTKTRAKLLFFRRPPDRPQHSVEGNLPDLAVRDGYWKLLCEYDGSKPQLYNLRNDVGEKSNVADAHPIVVDQLAAAVLAWHNSMPADKGASFAAFRKPGDNSHVANPRQIECQSDAIIVP